MSYLRNMLNPRKKEIFNLCNIFLKQLFLALVKEILVTVIVYMTLTCI